MNQATSGRRAYRPLGWPTLRRYVKDANTKLDRNKQGYSVPRDLPRITARVAMLMLLAAARCAFAIVEQPKTSLMPIFPYIKFVQGVMEQVMGYWGSCRLCFPQRFFSPSVFGPLFVTE